MSLPYTYTGSLDTIFGYTGVNLAVWDTINLTYILTPTFPADQIRLGTGYWVNFPAPVTVAAGTPADPTHNFTITLRQGWTQIGDPFLTSIPIANLFFNGQTLAQATQAGLFPVVTNMTQGTIYTTAAPAVTSTNSSGYTPTTSLNPGSGYWIGITQDNVQLLIPAPSALPSAATNLVATPSNAQVVLVWQAAPGASSYNVYRGTTAGGESATAVATGITATTYTNTGLVNGTKYYYTVKSVNANGTSASSNEAAATLALPAPTGVTATPGFMRVALAWTAVSGATNYDIYEATAANGESATPVAKGVVGTVFVSSFTNLLPNGTNSPLTNGTTYYYKVEALNTVAPSPLSSEASATPAATYLPPDPPYFPATDISDGTGVFTTGGAHLFNWSASGVYLLSLPYTYGQSISTIFNDVSNSTVLTLWNPTGGTSSPRAGQWILSPTAPANQVKPGTGYWTRFWSNNAWADAGTPPSPAQNVAVSLSAGWNQIGDPYPYAVAVNTLLFPSKTYAQAVSGSTPSSIRRYGRLPAVAPMPTQTRGITR